MKSEKNKVIALATILMFCIYNLHITVFILLGMAATIGAIMFDATHQYFIAVLSWIVAFVLFKAKSN